MEKLLYSEILKKQNETFLEIQKKQNEFFLETLKNITETNAELMLKVEQERDYYHDLLLEKVEKFTAKEKTLLIERTKSVTLDNNSKDADNKEVISEYGLLVNEYIRNKDENLFITILEKYPDKVFETLKSCKDSLPERIDELAVMYHFVDKLKVIKQRKTNIDKLKKDKSVDIYESYRELCDKFHQASLKKKPTLIKRYIKQIYIQYPDAFENFKATYATYLPKNFEEILTKTQIEFGLIKKPKKVRAKTNADGTENKLRPRTDYVNISVEDLINQVNQQPSNRSQYIKRCLYGLEKAGRSKEDCNAFLAKA